MILILAAILVLGLLFQYRYLILSKLNLPLGTGEAEQALGLRRVRDVQLPGNPTRFGKMSIDVERRLLFIADQGNSRVLQFNLARQKLTGQVEGINGTRAVLAAPELRRVFAASTEKNQAFTIDIPTMTIVARADAGDNPDALAFVPELGMLFISSENAGTVTVVDAGTSRWQSTISVGARIGGLVYDPSTRRVYATEQDRNQLVEIDPRTSFVTRRIELSGCSGPRGINVDGIARLVFVGCGDNAQAAIVDLDTQQVSGLRGVGEGPDTLAFDDILRRLYVGAESGFVTVFQERGKNLEPRGGAYLAPNAHTLAVDPLTHWIYMPLENVDGHPVLRILSPLDVPRLD